MVRFRICCRGIHADGLNVGVMGKRGIKDNFLDFSLRKWVNECSVHQDWGRIHT